MKNLNASIRLRPTRIGFLVRPSDKKSVRKIMRVNACLWGGLQNPIIPVYTRAPSGQSDEHNQSMTGKAITQGYIKFFDPDVYVEAEQGLLERAGLEAFRKHRSNEKVVLLSDFFDREHMGVCEPRFGLSVYEVLKETYESERRFKLRDVIPAIYSSSEGAFSEAFIGCYPKEGQTAYLKDSYYDVFQPSDSEPDIDVWKKIYSGECETPFSITEKHYEVFRSWSDYPVILVFDPSNTQDLLDFWNLRIQPAPVYPVPLKWLPLLADSLRNFIKSNHRPLRGNTHGVMHSVTLEIAGSISDDQFNSLILPHFSRLPSRSFSIKRWRTPIWDVNYRDNFVKQPEQAVINADRSDQAIGIGSESLSGVFKTLAPKFADEYSGSRSRWANVVQVSAHYEGAQVALSLPFNTFDRFWPHVHFGQFACGREGWVFLQNNKSINQSIVFMENEAAFVSWFKRREIDARLSEAGRIAKQMLNSLGGFWGLYLIDDEHSIKFINKHAMSRRRRLNHASGEVIEEDFRGRSASIEQWEKMIRDRIQAGSHSMVKLQDYLDRNVIKVGLESVCDHCQARNWHSLDDTSYNLRCLRCLKHYEFPQGKLKVRNGNWRYRVLGPFSVPDYAQGAYTSLLTIRFFITNRGRDLVSSYSTALELEKNGRKAEVDFAILLPAENSFEINGEPRLIVGEAKSFGQDVVKIGDLDKLKQSADILEDTIIVISVLKDSFSSGEIELLKEFALWARKSTNNRPKHWVILLTGVELFNEYTESVWEDLGEPYSNYTDYHTLNDLERLSDATQAIHLGLEPYHQWSRNN